MTNMGPLLIHQYTGKKYWPNMQWTTGGQVYLYNAAAPSNMIGSMQKSRRHTADCGNQTNLTAYADYY